MPMMPKRVKFRKSQRGKIKGNATRGNTVAFGEYGLQALKPSWITARQIEAGRVAASHFLRREGRLRQRRRVRALPALENRSRRAGGIACGRG